MLQRHRALKNRSHYANMPMHYAGTFKGCENDHFYMKNCDIFLIFAQNIDCEAVLTSTYSRGSR